ncbi:Protein SYG1-like protein [Erysiphe neolycopersici]|uniref:Protein SYG1-like protein n=1 Tax=Erysiphe neolycopersici TaxID=212602 RepID=A0A420I090_9PEZI|nr:Protein SYG1-like protein [Erysiphe neolycopersici]
MSFGHNLDRDLVPEWRIKYVDYKEGKRHIKAISRAFHRVTSSSRNNGATSPITTRESSRIGPLYSSSQKKVHHSMIQPFEAYQGARRLSTRDDTSPKQKFFSPFSLNQSKISLTISQAAIDKNEKAPEASIDNKIASKLAKESIDETVNRDRQPNVPISRDFANLHRKPSIFSYSNVESTHITSPTGDPDDYFNPQYRMAESPKSFLSNVFSGGGRLSPAESHQTNLDIGATDILRQRQNKFFKWNNEELEKVETFYKSKEDEADKLLTLLREQLYEMRTRRIEELAEAEQINAFRRETEATVDFNARSEALKESHPSYSLNKLNVIFNPIQKSYLKLRHKLTGSHIGTNSKALQDMKPSVAARLQKKPTMVGEIKDGNDSFRKAQYDDNVPYRKAKKKLKLALLECYRVMEMLKSYAVINQMAFNKINRKYARVVGSSPHVRHLTERVNRSWFIRSNVLDAHIHEAIDLYARYFENGQHKIAFGKLRGSFARRPDVSGNAFRNGILIGVGTILAIQGIIRGVQLLNEHPDPVIRAQTSYLFQLYAGYFLALYLFAFFCLDCCIWTRYRINYQFVFEFDPRRTLDWREMANIPSFLLAFLGLCMWINFSRFGGLEMFIYYPMILIITTALLIVIPLPILFHRGRMWFLYSNWRLLLAGIYPVEFRDFFLGDIYCSLTYVMANIEVFFCLYIHQWIDPSQCGSTHSVLLGFFTALPAVWRALQCLRRYYDTRDMFPHLVNCGKYIATILFYTTLSRYRINRTDIYMIIFLVTAAITSVYVSLWDVLMDWSLLQPNAKVRFLRDVRGYRYTWWYYAVMILNPALRFDWILYLTNIHLLGHSTKVTFLVAIAEVTRRGLWAIFRVENEHCSNVAHFKASRAPQLPYTSVTETNETTTEKEDPISGPRNSIPTIHVLESQRSLGSNIIRRPFTRILADAHLADFEKRRVRTDVKDSNNTNNNNFQSDSSDDEEEIEPNNQVVFDVAALLKERRRIARETMHEEVISPRFIKPGL